MDLNRKQLSLLITIFTMGILVLLTYNIHLVNREEDEYVIEMAVLNEEELEELLKEEPEEQELKELAQAESIKSHMALNETAKPSYGNPEPLKTLDELMEERSMAAEQSSVMGDAGAYAASLKELAKRRQEKKEELGQRDADKKEFTNALKDKRTSISYSLIDRNAYDLPPPIYTCLEGGKVVINITVNKSGSVIDASFNEKSSSTNDYCLIENAITYALKAQFSSASKAEQIGTITYLFQRK
ncbi:energy transducer TonB [Flavobacterium sp. ASW18X]|uniref:energy transducer TonB family protein n=1 Tax=Flavobacterium sp. ASW18X TaxID=2572595 RepID=UPI0010ADA8FD|nr:energy transducer TonB [Flavobacterium sp. ASW18X]TKD65389.1 energy transducer TonB [Flavobacterium sp. ASW18X]